MKTEIILIIKSKRNIEKKSNNFLMMHNLDYLNPNINNNDKENESKLKENRKKNFKNKNNEKMDVEEKEENEEEQNDINRKIGDEDGNINIEENDEE